jgi:hypothetical protein
MAWLLIAMLSVLSTAQYVTYFAPTPLSESISHRRFPDFIIYFSDASYDFASRQITFRLQMDIHSATDQGNSITFKFSNPITGGFWKRLNLTYSQQNEYAYQCNEVGVHDSMYGLSERYPYEYYEINYNVAAGVDRPFDFDNEFIPYVVPYMAYPDSLRWLISGSASKVTQEVSSSNYFVDFTVKIRVERMPGYSSMISLFPVWTANVVLASLIFLVDPSKGKLPRVRERLAIYISLFVFISGFMVSVGSQASAKWLFSTSELFLFALLSSTMAFAMLSFLSRYRADGNQDHAAVAFSILSCVSFLWIDPIFYTWDVGRLDPVYNLTLGKFLEVIPFFVDSRVILWVVLIATAYIVPYAKVHHDFRRARLTLLLVGVFVFWLASFKTLHDPAIALVSAGYILFSWREIVNILRKAIHSVDHSRSAPEYQDTTQPLEGASLEMPALDLAEAEATAPKIIKPKRRKRGAPKQKKRKRLRKSQAIGRA